VCVAIRGARVFAVPWIRFVCATGTASAWACPVALPSIDYTPRDPAGTVLHRVVHAHLETFLTQAAVPAIRPVARGLGRIIRVPSTRANRYYRPVALTGWTEFSWWLRTVKNRHFGPSKPRAVLSARRFGAGPAGPCAWRPGR